MVGATSCALLGLWPFPHQCVITQPEKYQVNTSGFTIHEDEKLTRSTKFQIGKDSLLKAIRIHQPAVLISNGPLLENLIVHLTDQNADVNEPPQYGIDESYELVVSRSDDQVTATLSAPTIYGILYGLQTFTQLAEHTVENGFQTRMAMVSIQDKPRFGHRGVLVDTSRHYQSIESLQKVIDSLLINKLNVLHWHVIDEQSYPLEGPDKNFWKGAWSSDEIYTMSDVNALKEYAADRGVRIIVEFDMPGHVKSWGASHPELFPEKCGPNATSNKFGALNPVDATYTFLRQYLQFYTQNGFDDKYLHLGGDEVPYNCWGDLVTSNKTMEDIFSNFLNAVHGIGRDLGKKIIWWDEAFFGLKDKNITLPKDGTVVQVWHDFDMIETLRQNNVTEIVVSPQGGPHAWYLDYDNIAWDAVYTMPLETLSQEAQNAIIGGEGCMWGERVDSSNIMARIYPRLSAIAERLWTFDPQPMDTVTTRLAQFRCFMITHGFGVGELRYAGDSAVQPPHPSSCHDFIDSKQVDQDPVNNVFASVPLEGQDAFLDPTFQRKESLRFNEAVQIIQ